MTAEPKYDAKVRDRLLALMRSAEPTRNLNTTALTTTADEMLAMATRVGWAVSIEDASEQLLGRADRSR